MAASFYSNGVCALCSRQVIPFCDCSPGYYCSNETDAFPSCVRCPAGYYCPVGGDRIPPLKCPSNHWCPDNTFVTVPCSLGSWCIPERSYFILGPAICLALWAILLGVYLWRRRTQKRLNKVKDVTMENSGSGGKGSTAARYSGIEMNISLRNVGVKLTTFRSSGKVILDSVSGDLKPRKLTAIMGPSGAGKTTLLTVLRGGLTPTSGTMTVNGKKVRSGLNRFKKLIGFVPQDDTSVDGLLTVEEALFHSAALRLPSSTTNMAQMHAITRHAISVLGLDGCRGQLVGSGSGGSGGDRGLSGGQRKRVSIGIELVAQPSCLLLDEPTSGLDSTTSLTVMNALRRIADCGVNVIATIHQPSQSVFDCFDDLILMVPGGRVAYWGPASNALSYLMTVGLVEDKKVAVPDQLLDFLNAEDVRKGIEDDDEDNDDDAAGAKGDDDDDDDVEKSKAQVVKQRSPNIANIWERDHNNDNNNNSNNNDLEMLDYRLLTRTTPMLPFQFLIQMRRLILRLYRESTTVGLMCLVYAFTGFYLGLAFINPKYTLPIPSSITQWCPQAVYQMTNGQDWNQPCSTQWPSSEHQGEAVMYFCMGMGTVSAAFSVRTLSHDLEFYYREVRCGCNPLASFLSKMIIDTAHCALFSMFFLSVYFLIAAPYGAFSEYYAMVFAFVYVNFGIGYVLSVFLSGANAAVLATLVACVLGVFSGLVFQETPVWPFFFSEGLWRSEASIVIDNANPEDITYIAKYADILYGYSIGDNVIKDDFWKIMGYAMGLRFISLLALLFWNRKKQK